jgi:hypothetical protein
MCPMSEVIVYLEKWLTREKQQAEQRVSDMGAGLVALSAMSDDSSIGYRVEFFDGWPGHKDVVAQRRAPLREVMKRATTQYKITNKASDVQAQCRVYAILSEAGLQIPLPRDMWRPLFEEFGTYKPEK